MRGSRKTNIKTNRVIITDSQPRPVSIPHTQNQTDMNNNLMPECEEGTQPGQQDIYQYQNGLIDWQWVCMNPLENFDNENCPPGIPDCNNENFQLMGGPITTEDTQWNSNSGIDYWGPWQPLVKIRIIQSATQWNANQFGTFMGSPQDNVCDCSSYGFSGTNSYGISYMFPPLVGQMNSFYNVGGLVQNTENDNIGYINPGVAEQMALGYEIGGIGSPTQWMDSTGGSGTNPYCTTLGCEPPVYETQCFTTPDYEGDSGGQEVCQTYMVNQAPASLTGNYGISGTEWGGAYQSGMNCYTGLGLLMGPCSFTQGEPLGECYAIIDEYANTANPFADCDTSPEGNNQWHHLNIMGSAVSATQCCNLATFGMTHPEFGNTTDWFIDGGENYGWAKYCADSNYGGGNADAANEFVCMAKPPINMHGDRSRS